MRYRNDDGGFGSGMGGSFGTSAGYDPHREWDGPLATRGVGRDGSRVPREHEDERAAHYSEWQARQQGMPHPMHQQHGYGLSQYASPTEPERGPHYGKGPKGYKRSDDRIREEICEVMSRQGYIDASDIEVMVEGGVVRLTGLVETREEKRALEQMADHVHGVEEVQNEIRLRRLAQRDQPAPSARAPVSQNGNVRTAQS